MSNSDQLFLPDGGDPKCGWADCDHSKLTESEAARIAVAEHQRNISACKEGQATCDYSQLTPAEAKILTDAEHKRNYAACLRDYGYCDPSQLTAEETRSIQKGQ